MTNNNQNYERPAIELMFVESEAGFCQSFGEKGAAGSQGNYLNEEEDY